MTEFVLLNIPEHNFNASAVSNLETPPQNVCICCLTPDVPFIALNTCNHTMFFEHGFEFMLDFPRNIVCYQCHHILTKFQLFRRQVLESFDILNEQVPNTKKLKKVLTIKQTATEILEIPSKDAIIEDVELTNQHAEDNSRSMLNLQRDCSDIDNYSVIIPAKTSKKGVKRKSKPTKVPHSKIIKKKQKLKLTDEPIGEEQGNESTNQEPESFEDGIHIQTLKNEQDSSDFESDIPLVLLNKNKKKVKREETKKDRRKRPTVADKYDGKIRIVTLTKAEMMEERARDAIKTAYLKLPYKCETCITGFDHEITLKDHMDKRHGEKIGGFECELCKSVLSNETSYKEHTKRHMRRYECQACGKRNNSVYSVVKHYNECHGTISTSFTCQDCGFVTDSHRSYRYHRDKHKHKQQCSMCGNTFVNATGLRVHMYTVHKQSSRVYSCELCGKVYNARSGLVAHAASAHSTHTDVYCGVCRVHFRTKHNLAHHLKTHLNHVSYSDRRFICDECGTKFVTKTNLQEHIDWVHLKKRKHQCDKCSKVFKNSSALNKHYSYVHEKKRPPRNKICDYCGRRFTTLAILQSHIRTHTGERPLQCNHCAATFAHSAALYTHNKLIHSAKSKKITTI